MQPKGLKRIVDKSAQEPAKKTRKPRAPKKGDISHYTVDLDAEYDDGEHEHAISFALVIESKDVTLMKSDKKVALLVDGKLVEVRGGSGIKDVSFDRLTPVYKASKPKEGDILLYQNHKVKYLEPYKSGKYHTVVLDNGMTIRVTLPELSRV